MEAILKYGEKQNAETDINEAADNDKLKHQEIIDEVPEAKELDKLLYNELMGMVTGKISNTLYIETNLKRSGMEMWRRLNKNNDPKTVPKLSKNGNPWPGGSGDTNKNKMLNTI